MSDELPIPPTPEIEVRESVEEESVVVTQGSSTSGELPEEGVDLKEHLAELEQGYIQQALDRADGVVSQAAKLLNIRRTTLVEKMRKYGLQRAD